MPITKKKHVRPKRLRPKVGLVDNTEKDLAVTLGYVQAQAKNDPTNQLAAESAKLVASRTNLSALLGTRVSLKAEQDANETAILAATNDHADAAREYAIAAAKVAKNDPNVLLNLGVLAAAQGVLGANDTVLAPEKLRLLAGTLPGELVLKCGRVKGAGAYQFEYKLEPSQPADPWLPEGGLQTKHVTARVPGLAPGQLVRGRVRAVGGTAGPWSTEVVGRAK